ncbi:MAG: dihydroorotate dehydrogenase [Candidatus Staskawiczbacteria bacterium]|nr:dihydroorotate dehydrogenase [Candidatus Staskawiczbacteria bacterium]
MIDLSVEVAGIRMQNPIMPASGTFGYGEDYIDLVDNSKLGALVGKGTTALNREGNEQPRTWPVPGGMINFIGLQNPGVHTVVNDKVPYMYKFGVPIIINASGSTVEEYATVVAVLNTSSLIDGIEVNISCPNVKEGGVAFGQDPVLAGEVARAVRKETKLPLIFKLTPNVASVIPVARAVIEAGADAISLVNTFKARARIRSGLYKGQWIEGGYSGQGIMPIALKMVSDLYKAKIGVPIIGMGGISSLEDVLDFLESGADAVQIGTATFIVPSTMTDIIRDLGLYIEQTGCQSLKEWREKGFPMPKEK